MQLLDAISLILRHGNRNIRKRLQLAAGASGQRNSAKAEDAGRFHGVHYVFRVAGSADGQQYIAFAPKPEHLLGEDGLVKRIENGESFLCDRYYFSSYAYHGVRMPLDWVIDINRLCAETLRPDLTVFLDIDPAEAVRRVYAGRDKIEIFENEARLTEVRNLYLKVFEQMRGTEKVAVIDGSREREEIAADVLAAVLPLFTEE